jgi:hypothetical protein
MLTLKDVSDGDTVQVDCPTLLHNTGSTGKITGTVENVFDALMPDGSEGNLEFEIRYNGHYWIKYKPLKDGGTIQVLERKIR